MEKEIIGRVKYLVFSEENLERMINYINQIAKSLRTDYRKKLFKLRKNLNEIQLRITRQYEAIESGIIDIALDAERLKELKTQKERVENEISHIEELSRKSSYIQIDKCTIDRFRQEMEEIFIGDNPQEKRKFLKKFIETIIVGKRNITIRYYLPNSQALNIYHVKTKIH
jgi:hypothetical protein